MASNIQKIYPQVLSFAKVLTADKRLSDELIFQSLWVMALDREEIFENLLEETHQDSGGSGLAAFNLSFYQVFYENFKREEQAKEIKFPFLNRIENIAIGSKAFYLLPTMHRAALYLRSKTSFQWDDLAYIFNCPRFEVMVAVSIAREQMANKLGLSFENKNSPGEGDLNQALDESVYLYHKDCRELYLETFSGEQKCRFSKNVYPFLDSDDHEARFEYTQLKSHLGECGICQSELEFVKNTLKQIDKKIPNFFTTRQEQHDFEQALGSFLCDQVFEKYFNQSYILKTFDLVRKVKSRILP